MADIITLPELRLESGRIVHDLPVAYDTWGELNEEGDNALVVCHALTGNTRADIWWGPMIGPGAPFDTNRFFVVCFNVLGSPYGSLSPLTIDPDKGRPYGADFPDLTIRDTVRAHYEAAKRLGIRQVETVAGGSMGGMQALEWAFFGEFVRSVIPIAVGGRHSSWCIGWSESQRQAIYSDPHWNGGQYHVQPRHGLATARMIAMISYRSRGSFESRFGRERQGGSDDLFAIESYLRYQGSKLVERFDANCYVQLTNQMDTHDVARGRGEYAEVLSSITQPVLVLGVDSDILYPIEEQEELASLIPGAELSIISSIHGHDAFLIEFEAIANTIRSWMERHLVQRAPEQIWVGGAR